MYIGAGSTETLFICKYKKCSLLVFSVYLVGDFTHLRERSSSNIISH